MFQPKPVNMLIVHLHSRFAHLAKLVRHGMTDRDRYDRSVPCRVKRLDSTMNRFFVFARQL